MYDRVLELQKQIAREYQVQAARNCYLAGVYADLIQTGNPRHIDCYWATYRGYQRDATHAADMARKVLFDII